MAEPGKIRASRCIPFFLVAVLIAARSSLAIVRAEFWAEDGPEFFARTLQQSVWTLFEPVTGYYLFASRFIGYLAGFFPVVAIPYVYSAASLLVGAFAVSYFARPGFSWIVPSPRWRYFLVCLLALGPGTAEVFFNLSNLQAPLTLLGFFLLLERPFALSARKFAALAMIFFSSGSALLMMPLIVYFACSTRAKRYWAIAGVLSLAVAMNWIANARFNAALDTAYASHAHWHLIPQIFVERSLIHFFAAPFLGNLGTHFYIVQPTWVFWLLGLIGCVLAFLALGSVQARTEKFRILLLAYLCTVALFAMVAIGRAYNLMGVMRQGGQSFWGGRYSYLPGSLALILWSAYLIPAFNSERLWKRTAAIALFVLVAAMPVLNWGEVPKRPNGHWPDRAVLIQEALNKKNGGSLDAPVSVPGIVLQPGAYSQFSVTISP